MYDTYYKFTTKPFRLSPDCRFFFGSQGHKRAFAYLRYGLEQREGFIIITGGIGTGKTTLVEMLFNMIKGAKLVAAKLVTTQLDADNFIRMVAASFGLPHDQISKSTVLKNLEIFFYSKARSKERVLLVIDEAQNIPRDSLEELRMLSNIHVDGSPVLQTFLLGQDEFLETIQAPNMEQLRQRIIAAYHLKALEKNETQSYIEHRLNFVGWRGDPTLDAEAHDEIYLQTGGIPRKINTFCDRLFLYGFLEELHAFTRKTVLTVADELNVELDRFKSNKETTHSSHVKEAQGMAERIDLLEERLDELEDAMILERSNRQTIPFRKK